MQVCLQHRLGLRVAGPGDQCSSCAHHTLLDAAGHHQLTCSSGGFVTSRHNRIRDALHVLCRQAGMNPELEQGASHGDQTRPADILIPHWSLGKSAAFDLTVVSPLTDVLIQGAGELGGLDAVSAAAEKKHRENDDKCDDLGWLCVPLAVDTYGRWCDEAHKAISTVAVRLQTRTGGSISAASCCIYNTLGVLLARHNARSILARRSDTRIGAREVCQLGASGRA